MKKTILAVGVLAMMLVASASYATTADMIAGNPKNGANVVGEVTVTNDGSNIIVTYQITDDDWHILTTHLHIWNPLEDDGPKVTGGGPVPGQFAWITPDEGSDDQTATYTIPLSGNYPGKNGKVGPAYSWAPGETLNVAAHAVVQEGICSCEELLAILPVTVNALIEWPGLVTEAYFDVTITDGILSGQHKGWCADSADEIDAYPDPFDGEVGVFPTICGDLEAIPQIDYPLNLPKVNWILNNLDIEGGPFTPGDIQYAIWALLSGTPVPATATQSIVHGIHLPFSLWPLEWNYSETRGNALVDAAVAWEIANEGMPFVPGCGDIMTVVLIPPPIDEDPESELDPLIPQQAVLIEVPAPCCGGDETAWAGVEGTDVPGPDDGDNYTIEFAGSDWAMYFQHLVVAP